MKLEDIKEGRTYRAKKPANCKGFFNDRTVIYVGHFDVQYDGPAVSNGSHYPSVTKEKFLKWAGRDVTDELPEGRYQEWCATPIQPPKMRI